MNHGQMVRNCLLRPLSKLKNVRSGIIRAFTMNIAKTLNPHLTLSKKKYFVEKMCIFMATIIKQEGILGFMTIWPRSIFSTYERLALMVMVSTFPSLSLIIKHMQISTLYRASGNLGTDKRSFLETCRLI